MANGAHGVRISWLRIRRGLSLRRAVAGGAHGRRAAKAQCERDCVALEGLVAGGECAVDGESRTGDERAFVAEQEGGEGGDLRFVGGPPGRLLVEEGACGFRVAGGEALPQGVLTSPVTRALTRTPSLAASSAVERVRPTTPCLAAA